MPCVRRRPQGGAWGSVLRYRRLSAQHVGVAAAVAHAAREADAVEEFQKTIQ